MTRPESHAGETGSWEQNEVTGGISPVSPFCLTSCPTAAVSLGIEHVWQGDVQVSKRRAGETEAYNSGNLAKQQFPPAEPATEEQLTREGKREVTVLFLFSRVGSCVSASHLRFQPSHVVVCLFRVYEHCHLVVISKASNYSCLHLREGCYINTEALVKILST